MTLEMNDPRLTAYALGELDEQEAAGVEEALASDPKLQAVVDETRAAVGLVDDVLALEPALAFAEDEREALTKAPEYEQVPLRVLRRARGLRTYQKLAAVLLVFVGLWAVQDLARPYVHSVYAWADLVSTSSESSNATRESIEFEDYADQSRILRAVRGLTGSSDDRVASAPGYFGNDNSWDAPADADRNADEAVALSPSLALEATALWQSMQLTQPPPPAVTGGGEEPAPVPASSGRMIIKNADMAMEVDSVPRALSRVDAIAAESGGYVTETRTELRGSDKQDRPSVPDYAVIGISVPVDRFESAMARLREIGVVTGESASGSDVTNEFVDVQSQIANLEATQARIRGFLDQAKTVEEALRVNAQLTEIEGQISKLKGRMQYLSGRAAFSTITIEMVEAIPETTPTPTFTATPTATPTVTPTPTPAWDPGRTARSAADALTIVGQSLTTILIWFVVLVLPVAAGLALVYWVGRKMVGRFQ